MLALVENTLANWLAAAVSDSAFWLSLILAVWIIGGWRKRRRSRQLRSAASRLLDRSNDAIHRLLNAAQTIPAEETRRGFELWEFAAQRELEEMRRRSLCSGWQVDHFQVLNRFEPVNQSDLKGMISEKAARLKEIVRQLEEEASRLWPF